MHRTIFKAVARGSFAPLHPGLVTHDLPGVFPPLDSELYWRRENSEDVALSWLRSLILETVQDIAPPLSSSHAGARTTPSLGE